ncbi:MAG: 4Fe-4S cluster-binding domain-containing protein [Elusimicrobiota bacterium]|jgi:radical SAM protein with 4Fe4S-binding SPASM domain|nr:4Fe-4S cluster-binding domain-containing protein [Elusimicrobiota bacterium]
MIPYNNINEFQRNNDDELSKFKWFNHKLLNAVILYKALDNKPTRLTIAFTKACNLNCKYCYAEPTDVPQDTSNNFDLDALDKYLKDTPTITDILFIGGEVLLNPKLIEKIMKKYPHYKYIIQSNGILSDRLDEECARKAQWSIGFEPQEFGQRVNRDGVHQYNLALPKIKNLLKIRKGCPIGFVIPFGHKYDFSIIDFVDKLKKDLETDRFAIRWSCLYSDDVKLDFSFQTKELIKLIKNNPTKYFDNRYKYIGWDYADRIKKLIGLSAYNNEILFNCGATNSHIAFGPDNKIYMCSNKAEIADTSNCLGFYNEYDKNKHINMMIDFIKRQNNYSNCDICKKKFLCNGVCLMFSNYKKNCTAEGLFEIEKVLFGVLNGQTFYKHWNKVMKNINNKQREKMKLVGDYEKDELSNALINGSLTKNEFEKIEPYIKMGCEK